jgi:sn-glycerol 3-phosphate transport system permease protein
MLDELIFAAPVLLLAMLAGGILVARDTQGSGRGLGISAGAGAGAGLAGALVVAAPLDFCTFGPTATTTDRWFGNILIFAAAYVAARLTATALDPAARRRRMRSGDDVSHGIFRGRPFLAWVLLSPTLLILALFLYWPALRTIRLSTKLVQLGAPRTADRCVTNFTELIGPTSPGFVLGAILAAAVAFFLGSRLEQRARPRESRAAGYLTAGGVGLVLFALTLLWTVSYRQVFITTLVVSVGTVVGGLAIALAIAVLAYQPVRGGAIYRTLLIWPYAISPPIAGLIFYVMFDPNSGIVKEWLNTLFGVALPNYRQNSGLAVFVVILASIWKTLGYNLLFYIAGLQTVPDDQLEAAMLDGAGAWKRFRFVVLPAISPITFFLIVTNLTYAFFETFGTIEYLTAGGPARATTVAMYEIYQIAIPGRDLGRGAAQSLILFIGVVALTIWQFRSTGRKVSYGR